MPKQTVVAIKKPRLYIPTGNPVGRPKKGTSPHVAAPASKGALRVVNRYDAGGNGNRVAGWNPPTQGPNVSLSNITKVRDRTRDTIANDWAGERSVQTWATTLIGMGITPRFKRIKSKTRRQALTDMWNDFVKQADADCVLDFYGMLTLAVRAWVGDGEVFIRMRPRSLDANLKIPFQIQLLESDYCPQLSTDSFPGLPVGNKIRLGVEVNSYGRRVAYWFYKENPSDGLFGSTSATSSPTAANLVRVAASQVKHMFMPIRPGQMRGVTNLASILTRLRDTGDYEDAVLLRQKLGNLFVAFITRTLPDGEDLSLDALTGQPLATDSTGSPISELAPGLMQELDTGQDVKFSNPPEAGTMFSEYLRTTNLGTAAGQGIPYEIFAGDIQNISDRTLRVIINEFRRLARQKQWQVVIPMMCQTTLENFVDAQVLAGEIGITEADLVKRCEWAPHGWDYIHPTQDPQGKQMEVNAGFRSRSSVIGERGDDPDETDQERADDKAREDELGLSDALAPGETQPLAAPPKPGAKPTPAKPQPKPKSELELLAESIAALGQQMQVLMARQREPEPASPQNITVNANIATPAVQVDNKIDVQPTPIENNITLEPTPIENNVTLPPAQVTNIIDVQPTPVQIDNHTTNNIEAKAGETSVSVTLPDRKTTSIVNRDGNGDITKVTQTETSI